jgi:soluble lytic murein transglycosylase-like protein
MKTLFLAITALLVTMQSVGAIIPDCETLAERAARQTGVPAGLLSAIARVESGRSTAGSFRAWPWTLNQAGKGSYHSTEQDALHALEEALATGRRNVDVGCMQINVRWHAHAFSDPSAMMDPVQNTDYAARLLRDLHNRFGDWTLAVMHYHSSDPQRGKDYAARVMRHFGPIVADYDASRAPDTPRQASPVQVMQTNGLLAVANRPLVALVDLPASQPRVRRKESWVLFGNQSAD